MAPDEPMFSVVLPTYNRADLIPWPGLVPSTWEIPAVGRGFLRAQKRPGGLAVHEARWRVRDLQKRLGRLAHAAHRAR